MKHRKQWMRILTVITTAMVIMLGLAAQSIEPVMADTQSVAKNDEPTPENPIVDPAEPIKVSATEEEEVASNSFSPLLFVIIVVAVALVFAFIGFFITRRSTKKDIPELSCPGNLRHIIINITNPQPFVGGKNET